MILGRDIGTGYGERYTPDLDIEDRQLIAGSW